MFNARLMHIGCIIWLQNTPLLSTQPGASVHTHTPPSRRSLQIVPVTLSDIGQGIIKEVTVKEWLIELRATANSDEDTEHISGWSL